MKTRRLLTFLTLPSVILTTPIFITSCNLDKSFCPLIRPTIEQRTKTITGDENYAEYVFKFSRQMTQDDFEFHIDEESREKITIKEHTLDPTGQQITLRIGFFQSAKPEESSTLNFKLTFKYLTTYEWKETTIDCILNYVAQPVICDVNFYIYDKGVPVIYETKQVERGKTVEKPADPTTEGATFRGWYKDSIFTQPWDFETTLITDKNTSIFGIYDYQDLIVNYDVNGGKWSTGEAKPQKVKYGNITQDPCDEATAGCVKAPTKDHYKYKGWYKDTQCQEKWNFATDKVTSNMTLHAGWEPEICQVHFKEESGLWTFESKAAKYNDLITEPEHKEVPGYTFDGWYTSTAFLKKWDFDSDRVQQDNMILWCRYIKI